MRIQLIVPNLCFTFMFYIINVFILWQPDSIRSWDGITWWQREGEGIDGCRVAVNGRWQQAEAHRHSCLPPFCCSVHYYYSCSLSDGRGDVEGRMVEWGRAGLLSDWARGRRGRKPLSRWLRHRGRRRRERERVHRTWVSAAEEEEEGGASRLDDWMGPAMPWWSMGQVLGFSHCRESALVLQFVFQCWGRLHLLISPFHHLLYSSSVSFPANCYEHRMC